MLPHQSGVNTSPTSTTWEKEALQGAKSRGEPSENKAVGADGPPQEDIGKGARFRETQRQTEHSQDTEFRPPPGTDILDSNATTLRERPTLESRIRGVLEVSSRDRNKRFLPLDQINLIVTHEAVQEELQLHSGDRSQCTRLAHQICNPTNISQLDPSYTTTRQRIFATLVRINKAAWISQFVDENLYDCHLPFFFPSARSEVSCAYRQDGLDQSVCIHLFSNWGEFDKESFERYQWEFQAVFFELNLDEQQKRPSHHEFQDNAILPFIEDHEREGLDVMPISGGFSDVWRIKIHPAHHNYSSHNNPYFAVKRLKPNSGRDKKIFQQEVSTLNRLSGRHAHLMRLLLTYEYQDRFHLLFLWSDGNLRDYWERHPNPIEIPRTQDFALSLTSQWLGLAGALLDIHTCAPDEDIAPEERETHDEQRTNGRHGDIKPENILRFASHAHNHGRIEATPGKLVLADFGLTEFHRDETGEVNPINIARSPTYRAPEYDVRETISQSYDIWSLGCVLLEFIIWYVQGHDAFDQFSRDRAADDNGVIREDVYFKIVTVVQNGRNMNAAEFKPSVAAQCCKLREDPSITQFIIDALDFIEDRMLRMDPDKRATCADVVQKFKDIYAQSLRDQSYCVDPAPIKPKRVTSDLSMLSPYVCDSLEGSHETLPRTAGQTDDNIAYFDFQPVPANTTASPHPSSGFLSGKVSQGGAVNSSPEQAAKQPPRSPSRLGAEESSVRKFTWRSILHKLHKICCFKT